MTAIIGYSSRTGDSSIGVLCADDLEGFSKTKADKLTKLSNRFVLGVTGLEALDWAISYNIGHFDQFSGSRSQINSIEDLENLLNDLIPDTFTRWKKAKIFDNIQEQIDFESSLIVLDLLDNSLYYSNLGKLWKTDEEENYEIKFEKLSDGFYTFGIAAVSKNYDREEYSDLDIQKVQEYLNLKMKDYKSIHPESVGNSGAKQINYIGLIPYESFTSCYNSPLDLIQNMIERSSKK